MIDTLVRLADDTPTPIPTPTIDPDLVTPGPVGFIVMVVLVVMVTLIIFDMLRRVRRVRYRDEVREELDAEEREMQRRQAAESGEHDAGEGHPDATDAPSDDKPDA